jgi:hypothetical protein
MNALRFFAVFAFVAGIGLLVVGFVRSGDSGAEEARPEPVEFTSTLTATPTPTVADATATETLPATPTPTPFTGGVARMLIPRFSGLESAPAVDSLVETIGLRENNQLDVPHDPLNTGWYDIYDCGANNSCRPGWLGNAVFAAHVDYYPDIRGPFFNLRYLQAGDDIIVVMEDGTQYVYDVISYTRYDVDTIPMGDLIWPQNKPAGAEWITLITCGGEFQSATPGGPGEYLNRDVVVAQRVQ